MFAVTLWPLHITIVTMERQQCFLCVLLSYSSVSTIEKCYVLHSYAFMAILCCRQQ